MKKTTILITVFALFGFTMSAQAQGLKRRMADQYFTALDYYRAASIYDEIAAQTVKGKKQDWDAVRRAAESNYKSLQYSQSEKWYAELEKAGKITDDDYLTYIEVLRLQNKHDQAWGYIETQHKKYPDNKILAEYYQEKDYVSRLMEDSLLYKVREAPFNTGLGEYSPAYYEDGLAYTSRRRNSGFVNRKSLWDNSYYSDVYYVEKKGKSFKKRGKMLGKPFKTKAHDGPLHSAKTIKQQYLL